MKVVVLSSFAFSLVNFRGALLRSMAAAGHQVIACAPDHDPDVERALAGMGVGFRRIALARAGANPLSDLGTLARYVWLILRERPDVVLAYTQKPIIYGGIAARLAGGRPFYALMSGLGYSFSEEAARRPVLRWIVRTLFREGVRRARAIFVFNGDDRREMLAQGIIGEDSLVLQVPGSGVDVAHFPQRPVPDGPPCFLMIARLMRDKGLFEYVEAARMLRRRWPEARFRLLGRIDAENPTSVAEDVVRKWQTEGLIDYAPETRDVRPLLAGATVFVLPSYHREGLPRTILEAMATGRAVVTTDMPGCREPIVEGYNGFLVPPRDAAALADAMARFLEDPSLAASMGRAARLHAETEYDVHKVNRQLLTTMGLCAMKGEGAADMERAPARPLAKAN